jgi:uncharacterized membrane protein YfhO
MNIIEQLWVDGKSYLTIQYRLLQVRATQLQSQVFGMLLARLTAILLLIITLIFLAISLAAFLEYWLPMWASYLIISGLILLVLIVVVICRKYFFVRPIEKELLFMQKMSTKPTEEQIHELENQSVIVNNNINKDIDSIRREWVILGSLYNMFAGKK